jgi:signal transduction histidine kinase
MFMKPAISLKSDTVLKKRKRIFSTFSIKSFKRVCLDIGVAFTFNTILIYVFLLFIPDTSVAMISVLWVGIVAWRGGILAGLLACVIISVSNGIGIQIPPNNAIPMQYFIDGKISAATVGFIQTLVCGLVVGYISTLVHLFKIEIHLREETQLDLEQKNAELNAFGHTVAHDLKNPLMVINVSIESLIKELSGTGSIKQKKMMTFIQSSTNHMVNIIESLLLFAGIRKINEKDFSVFPISQCVDAALKRLEYNIEANHVSIIKIDIWPSAFGYAPWITEVWVNYINNAIKYGGDKSMQISPEIELGFDMMKIEQGSNQQYVRFWVKDNGGGIPEDKAITLFQEFSRLHSTQYEGHGLGLSIVKSVTEKLGGTVGVQRNKDRGSCFFFTLPTSPLHSNKK